MESVAAVPRRILVVCPPAMSDLVASSVVFSALREHLPEARVDALVQSWLEGVLHGQRFVDQLWSYDPQGRYRGPTGLLRLVRELRASEWDAVVGLWPQGRGRLIHRLVRTSARWRPKPPRATRRVAVRAGLSRYFVHRTKAETMLTSLAPLGVPSSWRPPRLTVAPRHRAAAEDLLRELGLLGEGQRKPRFVALAPGARFATARWPAPRYAELAKSLQRRGATVLVVGSAAEQDLCASVTLERRGIYNLAGRVNTFALVGLLSSCTAVVGNDAGPAHLAAALGVPTVMICGPTDGRQHVVVKGKVIQRPVPCGPCTIRGRDRCRQRALVCMEAVDVEEVEQALEPWVERETLEGTTATWHRW